MLHPLPFSTFGQIAALGLEVGVYCPGCFAERRIDPASEALRDRCFATIRFRCSRSRWNGLTCNAAGSVTIRPRELLKVGDPITLTFLFCNDCVPPWDIKRVQLDKPPWLIEGWKTGDRFQCPGCRGPVSWHIHGPAWRPGQLKLGTSENPAN